MTQWKLYSYPSCTSCRRAEAWLSQEGISVEKTHIYDNPPSTDELREMAAAHPQGISALVGTRSRVYRELGLKDKDVSEEEWYSLFEKEPRLLRRPILWNGKDVIIGWKESEYESAIGDAKA